MANRTGNSNAFDLIDGATAYSGYLGDTQYAYDAGVMILPVASETSLTVQVRQHGGYGTRRVTFDVAKQGNPPIVPAPDNTLRDTLVSTAVSVPTPTQNPNTGTFNWRVKGQYDYVTSSNPRIPGVHMLPTISYPYPTPVQDAISAQTFSSQTPEQVANQMIQDDSVLSTKWAWTLTSYPSNLLMNPELLGGD